MEEELEQLIKAGFAGILVNSYEEQRVEKVVKAIAEKLKYSLWSWSCATGLASMENKTIIPETDNIPPMLKEWNKQAPKSILLAKDLNVWMGGDRDTYNPFSVRGLREAVIMGRDRQRIIIAVGCKTNMAPELEREFRVVRYDLPSVTDLSEVAKMSADSAGSKVDEPTLEKVCEAGKGMTLLQFEDALSLSIVRHKRKLVPETVMNEKVAVIRNSQLLEYMPPSVTVEDIGGLEYLKADLLLKRRRFTKAAAEFGLPTPRGILACGQPGSGKSLTAWATSSIFGVPLLRLEAGRLFGSLVGQSEGNWRTAHSLSKAVAPCVLWIDEVDGLFSGMHGAHTDGGTTMRVLKAILQDMQLDSEGIMYFFTANDITHLPDPLIDRLDVWSVDLPNPSERREIWHIHIKKRRNANEKFKRDPKNFNIDELVERSEGYSGRQIEAVWIDAVTVGFNDGREPTTKDVIEVLEQQKPTSVTMREVIEARRLRLHNRSRPASRAEKQVPLTAAFSGRKIELPA